MSGLGAAPGREAAGAGGRRRRQPGWPLEPDRDDRLADRANPVLVRDVFRLRRSRLLLLAVCILSFVLLRIGAAMAAGPEAAQAAQGRAALQELVTLLVIVCWSLIPFLTFLSTREEVTGAVAESLLLSGLTPAQVLSGKLQGALLRGAVVGGLTAPLLAMAHAVGGATLPTLLLASAFGVLGLAVLSTLAVAAACACRGLRPRALPIALAAATGGALINFVCPAVPALLRLLETAAATGDLAGLGGAALAMTYVAAAAWCAGVRALDRTAHRHVASLRAVALALPFAAMALLAATATRAGLQTAAALAALGVMVATMPIWLGAATEDAAPPRRPQPPWLAALSAPLAPGRGNGLLFVLLLTAATALLGFGLPALAAVAPATAGPWDQTPAVALLGLGYLLLYSGLGAVIRGALDRRGDPHARLRARLLVPVVAVASWALPLVWNGIRGVRSSEWSLAHLPNPVTTIAQVVREGLRGDQLLWLGALAGSLLLCSLPAVVAALRAAVRGPEAP